MFGIPSNVLIVIVGVLVLVFMNTNALSYIKALFAKKNTVLDTTKEDKEMPKEESVPVVSPVAQRSPEIYEIVEQWDVLRRMCEKARLLESVKSLDSVFLNLLKKVESDDKNIN